MSRRSVRPLLVDTSAFYARFVDNAPRHDAAQAVFEAVCRSFDRFDDQTISFIDHSIAVLSRSRNIDHVFAFDDDFRTFDLTLVPEDTGEGVPSG
jgi:predicted nucleic acid-binding protein